VDEQIQAAVYFDEMKNTVQVELSNFDNKDIAMEAARLIIAALGIQTFSVKEETKTIH